MSEYCRAYDPELWKAGGSPKKTLILCEGHGAWEHLTEEGWPNAIKFVGKITKGKVSQTKSKTKREPLVQPFSHMGMTAEQYFPMPKRRPLWKIQVQMWFIGSDPMGPPDEETGAFMGTKDYIVGKNGERGDAIDAMTATMRAHEHGECACQKEDEEP